MQPFRRERHNKPHKCRNCPKSFKSSNGLKYHLDKVHIDEKIKMETECAEGTKTIFGSSLFLSLTSRVFLYFDLSKGSVLTPAIVADKPRAYTKLQFVKYLDQN